MDNFIREKETIYIGGNKSDFDKTDGVNITHLGFGMSKREHMHVIAYCFGIKFVMFKNTDEFEKVYPKFIEWQEKLYGYQREHMLREIYNKFLDTAEVELGNIMISIAINYVNPEDIRNYIYSQKAKSYKEGYEEHKKQLRIILGLERGEI